MSGPAARMRQIIEQDRPAFNSKHAMDELCLLLEAGVPFTDAAQRVDMTEKYAKKLYFQREREGVL